MPEVAPRPVGEAARARLVAGGVDPRLVRLFAARGVADPGEVAPGLASLLAPERLAHAAEAAALLADSIAAGRRILVVADYDADGATACAVALRALRAMGATVEFQGPLSKLFAHRAIGQTPPV